MKAEQIVILEGLRTPIGSFLGSLSSLTAPELAAYTMRSVLEQTQLKPTEISEVILGCVLTAGLGQAPARQAIFLSNIQNTCGATTINKMCGSGMKAIMLASSILQTQKHDVIIAGGMESMSNTPHLLSNYRKGQRLGHQNIKDHILTDGLEDAYNDNKLMGWFAEETAKSFDISRIKQDEFALQSLARAQKATQKEIFKKEIIPIHSKVTDQNATIEVDEGPLKLKPEKIPELKPIFQTNGTVTAANSSSISDGAASLLLTTHSFAQLKGLTPKAVIKGFCSVAIDPKWFTLAPISAVKKLLDQLNWKISSIDLFEVNEAFAVVPLIALQELNIPSDIVNIHGGACALGHPLGATGARIVVTLLNALERYQLKRGIATLCIGGGEATAIAIERI